MNNLFDCNHERLFSVIIGSFFIGSNFTYNDKNTCQDILISEKYINTLIVLIITIAPIS